MRTVFILVLILMMVPAWARADRIALVIGNGGYLHAKPLPNAVNDATDMAESLQRIGFQVFSGNDLTGAETLALVQDFSAALQPDDLALFYYAGHGAQFGTENFLIPVDILADDEAALTKASVRLQSILRSMELRAGTRIVILDACRNNPFVTQVASRSGGEVSRGLAKVEAGVGSYIAFSTQPGNVALDGTDRNSPFTAALLRHIGQQGADIHAVMRQVRADVVNATDETQVPWENSSLVHEVFLAAAEPALLPQAVVVEPAVIETPQPPTTEFSYVGGLDTGGDGFLALRAQPSLLAGLVTRLPADTLLEVLASEGSWRKVRSQTGEVGWAFAKWIKCCRTVAPVVPDARTVAQNCEALWYKRNRIWHLNGYCFTSDRAITAFGNAGCSRGQAGALNAMSAADRSAVETLARQAVEAGCK